MIFFLQKGKLFMISGCVILFCFITFSNYAYREIFIYYSLFVKLKNKNKFINIIIFLLTLRFYFYFPTHTSIFMTEYLTLKVREFFQINSYFLYQLKGFWIFFNVTILVIIIGGIKKYIITRKIH